MVQYPISCEVRKWTVYVHINKINRKRYVGITSCDYEKRWNNGRGYKGQVMGHAIEKYGWDNFEHVIVGTNFTFNEANILEISLIKALNTLVQNGQGYNVSEGGQGTAGVRLLRNDISGERFGKLIALSRIEVRKDVSGHYRSYWLCRCDCGNYCKVCYDSLMRFINNKDNSGTGSCGCMSSRNFGTPKPNVFDIYNDYVIGHCNNGNSFIVDLEDYESIKQYTWTTDRYHHVFTSKIQSHPRMRIESIILGIPAKNIDKLKLKYLNNNASDVRKSNLIIYHPDDCDEFEYHYYIHNIVVNGFRYYGNNYWTIGKKNDARHNVYGLENSLKEYDRRYGNDLFDAFIRYKEEYICQTVL